jgi:hypothetical protein
MLAPGTGIRTIADAFVKVDIVLDAELRLAPDQKAEIVHRLDMLEVNNFTGSSDTVQSFTPPGRSSEIESVMIGKCHSIFKLNDCAATEFKHRYPPNFGHKKRQTLLREICLKTIRIMG